MPRPPIDVSRFWSVQSDDLQCTASADYHEHSKINSFPLRFGLEDPKRSAPMMKLINAVGGKSKDYAYCPHYALPATDWAAVRTPLGELLERRRSRRQFVPSHPIPISALATLLNCGAGLSGQLPIGDNMTRPARTHPSGGALYPLEIYPIALNVLDLPPGIFHFDVYGPSLSALSAGDHRPAVKRAFMDDPMALHAAAILVVTAIFIRSRFKYGERSYRFILLEAGHLMQNLVLVGQALGLSVVPMGGFLDRELEGLIDVDGVEESVVYAAMVGTPSEPTA